MDDLSDDDLRRLTGALAAVVHAAGGWHEPPRLYGLVPRGAPPRRAGSLHAGGRRWLRLADGDPYAFLDTVRVSEGDAAALALVANGWATPLSGGQRSRVRTVVVVTPDRRQCTAFERRDDPRGIAIDDRGEGPMLRALLSAWTTDQLAGPPPAA
jgi:hypothetical protein